jgi:hypothetical protein
MTNLNYDSHLRRQDKTYRQLLALALEASENKGTYLWVSRSLDYDKNVLSAILEPIGDIVNFKALANRIEIGDSVIMLASDFGVNRCYDRFHSLTFKTRVDHDAELSEDAMLFLKSRDRAMSEDPRKAQFVSIKEGSIKKNLNPPPTTDRPPPPKAQVSPQSTHASPQS